MFALPPLFVALTLLTSEGPPPILDPTSYRSPNGQIVLEVDPSAPDGSGPAKYALRRGDAIVWQEEKPWTFWSAAVTDEGVAAGYAYTAGYRDHRVMGEFHSVILGPQGALLLDEKVKRTASRALHTPPKPLGMGVFHQPELGRVVFRINDEDGNRHSEEWRCYQLPECKELWRKRPLEAISGDTRWHFAIRAEAIAGTPLTLVEWLSYDWNSKPKKIGVRLGLLDADLALVWDELRADDLTLADEREQDALTNKVRATGSLLPGLGAKRFGVIAHAKREQIVYEVTPGASSKGAWTVREHERSAYTPPKSDAPAIEEIVLEKREEVALGAGLPAGQHALRDIQAFSFAAEEVLRVVRAEKEATRFTLLNVDATGRVLSETPTQIADADAKIRIKWWPINAGHWLATQSPFGEQAASSAWIIDDASGSARRLDAFDSPSIDDVAGAPDGSFFVLATEHEKYTMSKRLGSFDSDGTKRWLLEANLNGSDESLFSPAAIARTTDGRIAVVDTIKKRIQTFGPDGSFERVCKLESVVNRGVRYPSGLEPDIDGGVLVHDSSGEASLIRARADNSLRAAFTPRLQDGRAPQELARYARVSPEGRLWTHDGGRLSRLNEQGVVELTLGVALNPSQLDAPGTATIDVFGRALVQDAKTGAIHVFDAKGKRLFVCIPEPSDFDNTSSIGHMAATLDAGVIVHSKRDYLRFGPDGTRIGSIGRVVGDLCFSPASALACGLKSGVAMNSILEVMDDKLVSIASVERAPDQRWMRNGRGPAVGTDGTIGMFVGPRLTASDPRASALALFSARGEAKKQIDLPAGIGAWRIALGRRWAVLAGYEPQATLVNLETGVARKFEIPRASRVGDDASGSSENDSWTFGFTADGNELLALNARGRRLLRFGLP